MQASQGFRKAFMIASEATKAGQLGPLVVTSHDDPARQFHKRHWKQDEEFPSRDLPP